jgi:hypothetical protein
MMVFSFSEKGSPKTVSIESSSDSRCINFGQYLDEAVAVIVENDS